MRSVGLISPIGFEDMRAEAGLKEPPSEAGGDDLGRALVATQGDETKLFITHTARRGDLSPSVSEEADMSPLPEKENCMFPVDDRKGASRAILPWA